MNNIPLQKEHQIHSRQEDRNNSSFPLIVSLDDQIPQDTRNRKNDY